MREIIETLSDCSFSECAIEYLFSQTKQFRQIVKALSKIEQIAKTNEIQEFTEDSLKEFIVNAK